MFGGRMALQGGPAMLLSNTSVQKELKLSEEQVKKVKEFTAAQMQKVQEVIQEALNGGGPPDREKMQEMMKSGTEAAEKFVKDTLKPEQQKRLKQISTQQMGLGAFANEEIAKALKITDEQKDKIKGLINEHRQDLQDLGRDRFTQEGMAKLKTLNKQYMDKVTEWLTADQKTAWKELLGEPFEVKPEPRAPSERRTRPASNPPPR